MDGPNRVIGMMIGGAVDGERVGRVVARMVAADGDRAVPIGIQREVGLVLVRVGKMIGIREVDGMDLTLDCHDRNGAMIGVVVMMIGVVVRANLTLIWVISVVVM